MLGLALIVALAIAGYFYQNNISYQNPELAAEIEAKGLAEKIGKLVLLPEGEIPALATVTDPELLRNQAFFVEAKRGDKVLIYANARKAILYRPDLNLVINISTVNLSGLERNNLSPYETGIPVPNEF